MITGYDIRRLVSHLKHRRVLLSHACQYVDLGSYLTLGGVPSRAAPEAAGLPFTIFDTDASDRERDVWNKVFANLSDFGEVFARRNGRGTPNAFGPIVLLLKPEALLDAMDIAITLRSAGEPGYDRDAESLREVGEVNRLFVEEAPEWTFDPARRETWIHGLFQGSDWLKQGLELGAAFPGRVVRAPEVSCSVAVGLLNLDGVQKVVVDPYIDGSGPLAERVERLAAERGRDISIEERRCDAERAAMYRELWEVVSGGILGLQELAASGRFSESLRRWARALLEKDQGWMFDRYARYLRAGTIRALST